MSSRHSPISSEEPEPPNLAFLMNVGLQVAARLGACTMTIGEILGIGAGSIVELDRASDEAVDLIVNGKAIARGEIVAVDEKFGVRVTEILEPPA